MASVRRKPTISAGWKTQIACAAVLLVALFPAPGYMVKSDDFKRCDQSAFCVRQRAYADFADKVYNDSKDSRLSPYELVAGSLKFDEKAGLVTASLLDAENKIPFSLSVSLLERNTARVQIKETRPVKSRYELSGDLALASELPKSVPISSSTNSKDSSETTVVFGEKKQNSLVIRAKPFAFSLSVNNVPAVTFNEHGYFYYEHWREKDVAAGLANQDASSSSGDLVVETGITDDEEKKLKEALNKDLWEETFKSTTDSKPNGPASMGFDISFPGSSNVYGLPEHAANFSLLPTRGKGKVYDDPYRLYNLDVAEYILDSPMALYGSIPFMFSHKKGVSAGLYWMNAAEMWVDVEKHDESDILSKASKWLPFGSHKAPKASTTAHWMAESGAFDVFIFLGTKPMDIFDSFTALTGRPVLPQHFAVAYHQCRWNYIDEQDVADVDANFDKFDIPYDVLWLDIEHTDGKRYFTWDSAKFPNSEQMQNNLAVKGRKMVTIIDPHIKRDDSYKVYKEAKDLGIFIKDKNGNDVDGWCWPGSSSWIDYTDEKARKYWAERFKFSEYKGSTPSLFTWNDMNEPSVFTGPEITMPKDALHNGGVEHRDVHNVYGTLLHRSSYEGHLLRSDNKERPFILSRAFFAGTQRYGAIWTGDNFAKWDHLEASVPMLLSVGTSGVVFSGADVGGFFGNPEPDLLVRWYQVAAFQPFFRAHAHIDTKRREPWLFGEPYTSLIRAAIRERYKILPYIYTLFAEATRSGAPIMRPLLAEFPEDEATFAIGDQFMLGSGILVKPVISKDQESVNVYVPQASVWYDYHTHAKLAASTSGHVTIKTPQERIPVLLRGGSIIPRRERVRRASNLMLRDPYTLWVALDQQGQAHGELYADDGHTFQYQENKYILSALSYTHNTLSSTLHTTQTSAPSESTITEVGSRVERLVIVGLKTAPKRVVVTEGGKKSDREVLVESEKLADGLVRVTLRDPAVIVGREWEVKLEF
ncbi:glycosyl hydrolases family 31-domain-containing protein [Fimicolochytrium jonesii]|uniref:glycosyl hydrolases family 31-domain-containing protein n=1 Tax=Fimicolochytrium jonesii TaxID=1396493 RepID=UPI0022FE87CB|nr:glycosyl hydrolases family 31-domain-containing protein [Fimicolochytrium jonesii]KAI8826243.1 glycosyl hydrolases family 31-domain-containing protein [Fimicolochytrium jonesii]